jgi:hypothetical protein
MENATSVDFAIMNVAAAVPGPHMTRAAVPRNSATSFLEVVTSAIDLPTAPDDAVDLTSFGSRFWRNSVRLFRTTFR